MGRAVRMTASLRGPAPVAIGFLIIVHRLVSCSFQAVATLPEYSSEELLLPTDDPGNLHRSQFPKDFIFGSGSSAFQVEGAASSGGKGISIWDTWCHGNHCNNGETADVAADEYHRYEEDLDLLADMNMDSYRFSIAWTRIFPNGTGPHVNMEGVAYYNRVIDAALSRGITPMVTLYHWDLPQALQDSYGGWMSRQSVEDFATYAEACFAAFGNRVKLWTTFNEPDLFLKSYGDSASPFPPRRSTMNASTDSYIAGHNVLLAHAAAVGIYRRWFQAEQHGMIGITVQCIWGEPLTNSTADIEAAKRSNIFQVSWFLDPLYFGDYPNAMRQNVGNRLPVFSEDETFQLKGSLDFIGLNHYTSNWVTEGPGPLPNEESNVFLDQHVTLLTLKDGIEIGPQAASTWLRIVPWGLYNLLKWTSDRYNAPIIVTENGMDYNDDLPLEDSLHDTGRIQYYQGYMSSVLRAAREGVDVRAYFAWSLLDNFEWYHGVYFRFGLIYVDYKDGAKRYPKDSTRWIARVLDRTRSTPE